MSFKQTYAHTLAVAVDILTASIFWNSYDVTVSSRCAIAQRLGQSNTFLYKLGTLLNKISKGHCEAATQADEERATNALKYLKTGKKDVQ